MFRIFYLSGFTVNIIFSNTILIYNTIFIYKIVRRTMSKY